MSLKMTIIGVLEKKQTYNWRSLLSKQISQGSFKYNTSCPSCGSVDNNSIYWHEDEGHYSSYCRGINCGKSHLKWDGEGGYVPKATIEKTPEECQLEVEDVISKYEPMTLKDRMLKESTLEAFGVLCDIDNEGEVNKHFYPTYLEDKHVGFRQRSKDSKGFKCFMGGVGYIKKDIQMFGQWLFPPDSYKRIMLVEGEIDCMTAYQLTSAISKNKKPYPVVSMPSGANITGIKANMKYITSFQEVVLAFDNDEAGDKLTKEACKILPAGKVHILKLPTGIKDLNEWWTAAKGDEGRRQVEKSFKDRYWNAEKYSPSSIKTLRDGWELYKNKPPRIKYKWPDSFGELNKLMYGGRAESEITSILAASSVGKTSFVKESIYELLVSTKDNIGVISLEETLDEFLEGMLAVHMSKQLGELTEDERDLDEQEKSFFELLELNSFDEDSRLYKDRIYFVEHEGALAGDELLETATWLVTALDCNHVVLDPVTLAVSGKDTDEDQFASDLLSLVKRYRLDWINVLHSRKNSSGNTANSAGNELYEEDAKGSGVWFQTAMNNLILMRNKEHEIDEARNTTKLKLSKCRRHGKSTGIAGYTYYDGDTGRLVLGRSYQEIEDDESSEDELADILID